MSQQTHVPAKVVIQELSFRRVTIDVNVFAVAYPKSGIITFNTPDAASVAGKVVETWISRCLYDKHADPQKRYLPDLILTHAAEWGLQ